MIKKMIGIVAALAVLAIIVFVALRRNDMHSLVFERQAAATSLTQQPTSARPSPAESEPSNTQQTPPAADSL